MQIKYPLHLVGLMVIATLLVGVWILSPNEVTVTGQGVVSVPASSATFTVTVVATGDDAATALSNGRNKVESIKKMLNEIHVQQSDVVETQVAVTPAAATTVGAKGYQAISTLSVKTNNVKVVGDMVVKMYEAGATVVSQPVVGVEELAKLEKEAIQNAMNQAKDQLRATVGVRPLKKVVAIQQASSGSVGTKSSATDQQGLFEVAKVVSVTYRVW